MISHKPKRVVAPISDEEAGHLKNIIYGGLMRTVTPSHMEEHFIRQGYARKAVGGLVATESGHHALVSWDGASS